MKIVPISVELIGHFGDDLSVVNAARVSMAKESKLSDVGLLQEKDLKLINYLAEHKHTSPFNHAFASFRIKAPIFVARQLVKHEYMPWNEVSRRYVDDEPEFYLPKQIHARAVNIKQGAAEKLINSITDEYGTPEGTPETVIAIQTESALSTYSMLLDNGVAPEEARMVLPLNTMTEWIWSGTLGAWGKMLSLRLDEHTQGATREVAKLIYEQLSPKFPASLDAYIKGIK